METFDFPLHTFDTEYPESGTRVQLGGNYIFTSPPTGPDLRRFSLHFETMFYYPNEEPAATNLLAYSTNVAQWFTYEVANVGVITSGYPAPDGTNTAQRVTLTLDGNTTNDLAVIYKGVTGLSVGQPYSGSVWMRAVNNSAPILLTHASAGAYTVANVTSTWKRFSSTEIAAFGTADFSIGLRGTYSPISTATIEIWGPQLESGSVVTSYIPNTGSSLTTRPATGVNPWKTPRINLAALEAFYNRHKMHKTFIYPHPVYGNVECKFYSPLRIPEGIKGGNGSVKDFRVELIEIVE